MKMPKLILTAIFQATWYSLKTMPFKIAGWFVVPFLWKYRNSDLAFMQQHHPRLMFAVNPEDWVGGWRGHKPGSGGIPSDLWDKFPPESRLAFWRYHALRNAAKGLRVRDGFFLELDADKIGFSTNEVLKTYQDWWLFKYRVPESGSKWWHVTWQDGRIGWRYIRYFGFRGELYYIHGKAGWRIGPYDKDGPIAGSHRWNHGTTPTVQLIKFGRAGSDYD